MKATTVMSAIVLFVCLAEVSHAQIFWRRSGSARRSRVTRPAISCSQYADHPLIKLIREEQLRHVGESWGFEEYQCFTWDELSWFKQNDVPGQFTDALRDDPEFLAIVAQIRQAGSGERDRLLYCASVTYTIIARRAPAAQPRGPVFLRFGLTRVDPT